MYKNRRNKLNEVSKDSFPLQHQELKRVYSYLSFRFLRLEKLLIGRNQ